MVIDLEQSFYASQILLTAIAAGSALFAWRHLGLAHDDRARGEADQKRSVEVAKATFLLNLDQQWNSPEMIVSRQEFWTLREHIADVVATKYGGLADGARQTKISELFADELQALRKADLKQYLKIMRMCGFFETVGLVVDRGYVPMDDFKALYQGPIESIGTCFRLHIENRGKESGVPKGLFEHALSLCDQVTQGRGNR